MTQDKRNEPDFADPSHISLVPKADPSPKVVFAEVERNEFTGTVFIAAPGPQAPGSLNVAYADEEIIVEYVEDAERQRWLGPLLKKIPWLVFLLVSILIVGLITNTLPPFLLFLGKTLLSPLSPVLKFNPGGVAATVIKGITALSWIVYIAIGWKVAVGAVRDAQKPTHMAISSEALYFMQHLSEARYSIVNAIYWPLITKVELVRPEGKKGIADYKLLLTEQDHPAHTIRMGDIIHPDDRKKLIAALKRYVDPEAIDEESLDVFAEPDGRESYTELWLKELSAAPKRDKLTPLARGNTLQDGEYSILSKIGMGGQGTVYLASKASMIDAATQQPLVVALKEFVLPVFPDMRVRKRAAEKFEIEARVLSKLDHPDIVKFIDLFVEDHRAYLALERVGGTPLSKVVAGQGALSPKDAVHLALSACHILQYLHSQEPAVIHRDFTPDNLMLQIDGTLKLIDFSVAQEVECNITGTVVGKHVYMSPEQFRGKPTTQSDIYSLGATLHYVLTGHEPEAISTSHPASINPAVPALLDAIVARATNLDPTVRYQSVSEMRKDLKDLEKSLAL